MSVRTDCTVPKRIPTSLAMLRRSRLLSHITRMCSTQTFSLMVASFGRPDRPSSSTLSLPLFNYAAHFFQCAIRRRLLPKGFHEVFINSLERHAFLTEVLDNRSDFKFLHFANMSHPRLLTVLYISNQPWPYALTRPMSFNKMKWLTDIDFN